MADDALVPFVFEGAAVRGACVRMDRAVHDALASHDYPPALARVLAELLAASTLLAASLKFRGSLIVQLAGSGPVRLAVVECDHALSLRATAQWSPAAVTKLGPDATLAELAGGGDARLAITLEPEEGPLYQGIVALEAGSVAALLEHYLASSEQLESRMALAERDGRVGGLLVQRLPGAGEDVTLPWDEASRAIDALDPAALVGGDPVEALTRAFPGRDLRVFKARAPAFACRCSSSRVEQALRIAGRDEIEAALADDGEVKVTCEYCGRRYTFTPNQARALFDAPAT
ncbi:MAG TPA: Hsp33 family molecular chaperone HslO [Casimicrobiaceae bacterium]|jgi:molecular chaperone Hsp33